jgi:hypothetical protein
MSEALTTSDQLTGVTRRMTWGLGEEHKVASAASTDQGGQLQLLDRFPGSWRSWSPNELSLVEAVDCFSEHTVKGINDALTRAQGATDPAKGLRPDRAP